MSSAFDSLVMRILDDKESRFVLLNLAEIKKNTWVKAFDTHDSAIGYTKFFIVNFAEKRTKLILKIIPFFTF